MNDNKYFECETANELWKNYFSEVDQCLTKIPKEQAKVIRKELESHAFEAAQSMTSGTELERLEKSLSILGSPKEIVPPMVADALINAARKSNNPIHVLQALLFQFGRSIVNTVRSISVFILILFSIVSFSMALLKPFIPENVGLFTTNTDPMGIRFGIFWETANTQEHLGLSVIPIALVLSFLFYKLSALILKYSK